MKKLIALLLAMMMVLTFAACGNTTPEETDPTPTPGQSVSTEGTTLTTNLWSLTYDDSLWVYEEDDFYDNEEYAKVIMMIPDEEDSYVTSVEIAVSLDDHEEFRDYLDTYGFDAYDYVVNEAYDLVNIGTVDCLMNEGTYWGEDCLRYFGRVEDASVTVFVEILGQYEDSAVEDLLAGLEIFAENIDNVDAPWPWDGEPFSGSDASEMAGTYTVSSQWVPFPNCVITKETFDHAVAVDGTKAYILGEEKLHRYDFTGDSLVLDMDMEQDGDFGNIQRTNDGTIWISGFMEPLISIRDGVQTASYEGTDEVTMHPSGQWGISWFSGPECKKITLSGGAISETDMNFAEVSTISTLLIDENYIYVCGSAADDSGHKVFIYDTNGSLKMTLADEEGEGLGSITFMAQTVNGFLGLDGNMREVILWTADGSYIGAIDDSDLFGTHYPWFCGGTQLSDGSILVIMTEDREDESAMELIAFVLKVA